jgi:hypothetical protein
LSLIRPKLTRIRDYSQRAYSFPRDQRERPDIIQRSRHRLQIDKQLVVQTAGDYDRYVIVGTTLRNLPIFDDCRAYKVDSELFASLLDKEIDKLIAFATSDNPLLFDSQGCLDGLSRKDFEDLSGLSDQMLCNMSILTHDNSRHGIEIPTIASEAWDDLIVSRRRLRTRYAQDESHVEGRQPITLLDPNNNTTAYHKLLDYIIGTITWWTLRSADSEYWKKHLLAILARWAVKMKLVALDPIRCAELTLSETHAMIQKIKYEAEFKDVIIKIGGETRDVDVLETEVDLSNLYFEEKLLLRRHLGIIFEAVLEALMRHERSGNDAESFEICSMIHRSGLEGVTNMLTGQKHGNIVASSNLQHINFCYGIFKLLELNTARLQEVDKASSRPSPEQAVLNCLNVSMVCSESSNRTLNFEVHTMDHAISLMVPLALMDPHPAREISLLMNLTNVLADARDPIRQFAPPPKDFSVEYILSTKTWLEKWHGKRNDKVMDPDIEQLSQSPLRRGEPGMFISSIFLCYADSVAPDLCSVPPEGSTTNPIAKLLNDYRSNIQTMSNWEISASSITVQCKTYAIAVQIATMVIIFGAVAVPFTVQERIKGVDPFQVTTFAWVLCGSLLIVAKSRYVNSWPWHDFLRGWVVCRTVSDLSDVSGVEPQVILLFLLHNEWNSLLVSDGPYNGMFGRKTAPRSVSESRNEAQKGKAPLTYHQGFSIDVPTHLNTMLASGFVVLKAMNASGEHLICIDGRKGGSDRAMQGRTGHWLTCPDFNSDALENVHGSGINEKDINKKIHMLQRVEFRWTKILGIYVKDSKFG